VFVVVSIEKYSLSVNWEEVTRFILIISCVLTFVPKCYLWVMSLIPQLLLEFNMVEISST